ncbi:hypothetical protein ACI2OX_07705 [Bacillus sp. N9]
MIYFDNSATTKPYDDVLETYVKVNRQFLAIHRPCIILEASLSNYLQGHGSKLPIYVM